MPQTHMLLLMRRFPYLEKAIEDRFLECPEFRALCADFVDAVKALEHQEDSIEPRALQRIAEYRKLVGDLEAELLVEIYRGARRN